MNDVSGLVDYLGIVVSHAFEAVAYSIDRKDTAEVHELSYERLLEDIASCYKHFLLAIHGERHKSIHQSVGVIDSEDTCSILRNILLSNNFITTERLS